MVYVWFQATSSLWCSHEIGSITSSRRLRVVWVQVTKLYSVCLFNTLTSVFHTSVLLVIMHFVRHCQNSCGSMRRQPSGSTDYFDNVMTKFLANNTSHAWKTHVANRSRSIYQYSNMAPRLSGQTAIFGVVFFVSKSLLRIEGQRKLEKFAILTRKPRSHAPILIYRTWPVTKPCSGNWIKFSCYEVKVAR